MKMVCVHAFSIEKAGKVLINAEPGDPVDLQRLPADARKRLCANGVVAAEGTELPMPAEQYQHPLPSSEAA